ncbi:atrial natriuretic peptide-converting enzyme-like [Babylonia areolata]|uniref:atrial natriuretic peptide-converting enzyme-like n=1 Tax=Babylonia areolata TaxID=304850 RepID=UPI003FD52B10
MSSTGDIRLEVDEAKKAEACYDNPLFHEEDDRDFKGSGAQGSRGSAGPPPAAAQDGHAATAKDYMHSLPPGPQPVPDITYGHRTRRRCVVKLLLLCLAVLVVAVVIGLIVHFTRDSDSSSRTTQPPVISLSRHLQGSLTIVDGPFSVYKEEYKDNTSSSFTLLLQSFQFKMDSIFRQSFFKDMYQRTDIVRVSPGLRIYFLIRLRKPTSLSTDDVKKMTSLIQDGFQDSLIVVGKDSVKLQPEKLPPMTTVKPVDQCEEIRIAECANLSAFRYTAFPNILGHKSQEQATVALGDLSQTLGRVCHGSVSVFLCALLTPQCGPGSRPLPPCRSFCEEVYGRCNGTMAPGAAFPVDCATLPDTEDPTICSPSPYTPGKCVPVHDELCQREGFNSTAFPNLLGSEEEQEVIISLKLIMGLQLATHCYNYSMLFGCAAYLPPCSGNSTVGFHNIPVCKSLCKAYRMRCEIFLDIFYHPWPPELDCDRLPDSPDPRVCTGYAEAHRPPEIGECERGTMKCDDHRCIPYGWRCDGYQDCKNNADEVHCATCSPHETLCSTRSALCINTTDVCDGDDNCYMGTDEAECVRVGEANDTRILQALNAVTGEWEEVCSQGWNQTMSLLACKQLGYRDVLAQSMETPTPGRPKAIVDTPRPGGHLDRLQTFLSKGHSTCPQDNDFIVKLTCWKPVCGTRPARYESPLRVVGGTEVKPGTWPWLVSMHGGSDRSFFCGGSIIHPEWVLTAGHCVGGGTKETSYWTLIAGHTRRQAYSSHRQIRKPRRLIVFPGYNHTTVDNDIALIQVDRPFVLTDYLRPVCLPRPNQDIPVGTRCYVAGWGKTYTMAPTYQQAVREVNLDVATWESCQAAVSGAATQLPYKLTHNMFCAGGSAGHDACQGDSGGPFMCRMPNTTDQWYQAGIVSWGLECAMPNAPGIYTKLPLFVDWIEETIRNNTST